MPYVQRTDGVITGTFANLQPGFAEEFLPDDNPEVVAFNEAANAPPPPTQGQEVLFDHENRLRVIEGQPPLELGDFTKKMSP